MKVGTRDGPLVGEMDGIPVGMLDGPALRTSEGS